MVSDTASDLEPNPDGPDLPELDLCFLPDEFALIPRLSELEYQLGLFHDRLLSC